MNYLVSTLILFLFQLLYFKIAEYFNIIDKPNQRSLHTKPVIRGGGIIFLLGVILYFVQYRFITHHSSLIASSLHLTCGSPSAHISYLFLIGLLAVGVISFLDDIFTLPNRYRWPVQFFSAISLLMELGLFQNPYWLFGLLLIVSVGILNAYNFMDGINGITGGYSTIVLLALYWVNNYYKTFIENEFLILILVSLFIFNFFNFRTKAVCFAGDVGSISIAFIILFLILKISLLDQNPIYILFLAVYGVDSVLTILHRLYLKQNIFEAHNLHLFQVVVKKYNLPHLYVASAYCFLQACLCSLIISKLNAPLPEQFTQGIVICVFLIISYTSLKTTVRTT